MSWNSEEVPPLQLGGSTAQAMSSCEVGRCNRPSQEVQPPDPGIPGFDRFELQI